jgi:hypothetical protein
MRSRSTQWLILLSACLSAGLRAEPLPKSFTLSRNVPGDCFMYVHVVDNPERHWIDEKWADVFQTALDSGIDQDIKKLVFSFMPPDQRAEVEQRIDRAIELVRKVRWADLARHEFVYAQRVASHGMGFDHMFLMRGADGSGSGNVNALAAIMKELADLTGALTIDRSEEKGIELYTLGARKKDSEKLDGFFWLFRKDDTIGAVMSPPAHGQVSNLLDDTLGMLNGTTTKKSMADVPRFREAVTKITTPQDVVSFFDVRMMLSSLGRMFETVEKDHVAKSDENEKRAVAMMRSLIDKGDVVDYVISSASTRGNRTVTDHLTRIQSAKRTSPIVQMCLDRKPFVRYDRYIPVDARSFGFSSGIDLQKLHDTAIEFIRKDVPGGENAMEQWNGMLSSAGLDLQRDFFSWYGGEIISVELPATMVTPMSNTDSVLMIRVKNPEVAREKVNAAIDFVATKMQEHGQMLMMSPAKCGDNNFREVTHPMLAMFLRPVIGVEEEWLIVSTSSGAVERCLKVATGDAASIKDAPRFREEGLIPERPFHSMSFKDLSRQGQEMAAAAAGVGMMGGMVVGMMPPDVPQEARQALQSILGIVAKLAPILQKIDFYSSSSAVGYLEDELSYRNRSVLTYKRPAEPKPAPESANAAAK